MESIRGLCDELDIPPVTWINPKKVKSVDYGTFLKPMQECYLSNFVQRALVRSTSIIASRKYDGFSVLILFDLDDSKKNRVRVFTAGGHKHLKEADKLIDMAYIPDAVCINKVVLCGELTMFCTMCHGSDMGYDFVRRGLKATSNVERRIFVFRVYSIRGRLCHLLPTVFAAVMGE